MKKRVLCFGLTINILFLCLCGRLFSLSVMPKEASSQQGTRVKEIAVKRGYVYDRNLVPISTSTQKYAVCIKPTTLALKQLSNIIEEKKTLEQLTKGWLVIKKIDNPSNYENCEDIKPLPLIDNRSSPLLTHIIGYTDTSGNGVCGIEKYYNDFFKKSGGTLEIAYSADANGRMLTNEFAEIRDNNYYSKDGIVLTIDIKLQEILEKALINGNIQKGAGVILDTQTNEILACASMPDYDINNIGADLNNEDLPFINRAFSAFPVGSVFKVVTAAASLENNILPKEYECNGEITFSGNTFHCSKKEGHGKIDFNLALAKSCNPYFIELGVKTGADKIIDMSRCFHLGESIDFGNSYMTDAGVLPSVNEFKSQADTGNFAFGQGRFTATPIQISAIFSCIGNGGYYVKPTLIKGFADKNGTLTENKNTKKEKILKNSTCNTIKNALEYTVTDGTGSMAKSDFYTCCSKTATAQSGQYDKHGNEVKFCWFAGFFPKENPQYTICILKEQGSSGGSDCGPVFKEIAENILFDF